MIASFAAKGRYTGKISGVLSGLNVERQEGSIKLTSINSKGNAGAVVLEIPDSEILKVIDAIRQEAEEPAKEATIVIDGRVTKKDIPEGVRLKVIHSHPTNPRADIFEMDSILEEEVSQEDGEKYLGWLVEA